MISKKFFVLLMVITHITTSFSAASDPYEAHRLAGLKLQTIMARIHGAAQLPSEAQNSVYQHYLNILLQMQRDPHFVGNRELVEALCIKLKGDLGVQSDQEFLHTEKDLVNEDKKLHELTKILDQIYELVQSSELYADPMLAEQFSQLYLKIEKENSESPEFALPQGHPLVHKFLSVKQSLESAYYIKDIVEGLLMYKQSFYTTHTEATKELNNLQKAVVILRGIITQEGGLNQRLIKYLGQTNAKLSTTYSVIHKNRVDTEKHAQEIRAMLEKDPATQDILGGGISILFAKMNSDAEALECDGKNLVADWTHLHRKLGVVIVVQS